MNSAKAILFLLLLAATGLRAEPAAGLDGATGHLFKMDLKNRSFELLKETEYAPKSDIGKSRFTVYWSDATTILKIGERTNFAGIQSPVIVSFHGIDAANAVAMKERRPFEARLATIFPGAKVAGGTAPDHKQVTAWFTPDAGDAPLGGTIELDGKPVEVSLRKRHARVYIHEPMPPQELSNGFWRATIKGKETDGRFVIGSMEVIPLPDPRATDDPKLPRVLVIGDSISMNYHEAAKTGLAGVANYHRNEGNCFSTVHGVLNMELWLGNYHEKGLHWDVIQFNHGLHDLKQAYDAASETFGEYAVPIEEYKANLEKEIAILRRTGAKLIWCSTTPVPNSNKGTYARCKGAEAVFNEAAMEVMRKHPDIIVNNLAQVVEDSPVFDHWRKGVDVHFYQKEEQGLLGDAVAGAVRKALEKPMKH